MEAMVVPFLTHGDIIVLEAAASGTVYAVKAADESSQAPAVLYLSSVSICQAREHLTACCLEVVEQDDWVGLRAPSLQGLYLQARKKAPQLVFYSSRLGVWEQWKAEPMYQGVLQHHSPALCLTSRQMPSASLGVRVWKVGSWLSEAPQQQHHATAEGQPASHTSRESSSSALQNEALELSQNVVKGYVTRVVKRPLLVAFRLWRAAAKELVQRQQAAEVHNQRRLLASSLRGLQQYAWQQRGLKHVGSLADQLALKSRLRLLQRGLHSWHEAARRTAQLSRLCQVHKRAVGRRNLATSFAAWASLSQRERSHRERCSSFRSRLASRRARGIFIAWRQMAQDQRAAVLAMGQRRAVVSMASCFAAWQAVTQQLQAARGAAAAAALAYTAVSLSAVFHAWLGQCRRRYELLLRERLLSMASRRRALAAAWSGWRAEVGNAAARRGRADLAYALRMHMLAGAALRGWFAAVVRSRALQHAAGHAAARKQRGLLPAVFRAWRAVAQCEARWDDECSPQAAAWMMHILQRRFGLERRRVLLQRALGGWAAVAGSRRRLRLAGMAVARRSRRVTLSAVMRAWRGLVQAGVQLGAVAAARREGLLRRRAMSGWVKAVEGKQQRAAAVARAGRRLQRQSARRVLAAWRNVSQRSQAKWHRAGQVHTVALQRRVLACWRVRCTSSRAAVSVLLRWRRSYEAGLVRKVLAGLRRRVVVARSVERMRHRRQRAVRQVVLRWWRRAAVEGTRLRRWGSHLKQRWRRCLQRGVLRAWYAVCHAAALQLQLLEAMEVACWRGLMGSGNVDGDAASAPVAAPAAGAGTVGPRGASPASAGLHLQALHILATSLGGSAGGGAGAGAHAAAQLLLSNLPTLARIAARSHRLAAKALCAWRDWSSAKRSQRLTVCRARFRAAQLIMAACFRAWMAGVRDIKARRAAAFDVALQGVLWLAARCLALWRRQAGRGAQLRRACRAVLGRRRDRLQRLVLAAWRADTLAALARKEQARWIKEEAQWRLKRKVLRAWGSALELVAAATAAAERRGEQVLRRLIAQVLRGWAQLVAMSATHGRALVRLVRTHGLRRVGRRALVRWADLARRERQRREDWPILCRAFYAWRAAVDPDARAAAAAAERLQAALSARAAASSGPAAAASVSGPTGSQAPSPGALLDASRSSYSTVGMIAPATQQARQPIASTAAPHPSLAPTAASEAQGHAGIISPATAAASSSGNTLPQPALQAAPSSASFDALPDATATAAAPSTSSAPQSPTTRACSASNGIGDGQVRRSTHAAAHEDDGYSSPVDEVQTPTRSRNRTRLTDMADDLSDVSRVGPAVMVGQPGGMAHQAYMWQQWQMMQQQQQAAAVGAQAGLPGGMQPPLLPGGPGGWGNMAAGMLMPAGAAGGSDAAAVQDQLNKLQLDLKEQQLKRPEATSSSAKEGAGPDAVSSPTKPPAPHPTLGATRSMHAILTASCRPEPGPVYQLKNSTGTTVGRASNASLSGMDSTGSAVPSPSSTPAPTAAAAAPQPATVHVVLHPYGPFPMEASPGGSGHSSPRAPGSRRATTDQVPFSHEQGGGRAGGAVAATQEGGGAFMAGSARDGQGSKDYGEEQGRAPAERGLSAGSVAAGPARPGEDPRPPSPPPPPQQLQQRPPGPGRPSGAQIPVDSGAAQAAAMTTLYAGKAAQQTPFLQQQAASAALAEAAAQSEHLSLPAHIRYQLGPPPRRLQPDGEWQRLQREHETATAAAVCAAQRAAQDVPDGTVSAWDSDALDSDELEVTRSGSFSFGGFAGRVRRLPVQHPHQRGEAQQQQQPSVPLLHPTAVRHQLPPSRLGDSALSSHGADTPQDIFPPATRPPPPQQSYMPLPAPSGHGAQPVDKVDHLLPPRHVHFAPGDEAPQQHQGPPAGLHTQSPPYQQHLQESQPHPQPFGAGFADPSRFPHPQGSAVGPQPCHGTAGEGVQSGPLPGQASSAPAGTRWVYGYPATTGPGPAAGTAVQSHGGGVGPPSHGITHAGPALAQAAPYTYAMTQQGQQSPAAALSGPAWQPSGKHTAPMQSQQYTGGQPPAPSSPWRQQLVAAGPMSAALMSAASTPGPGLPPTVTALTGSYLLYPLAPGCEVPNTATVILPQQHQPQAQMAPPVATPVASPPAAPPPAAHPPSSPKPQPMSTISTQTSVPKLQLLTPAAPDMAALDDLLSELEARSRSAMSSPRRHAVFGSGGSSSGSAPAAIQRAAGGNRDAGSGRDGTADARQSRAALGMEGLHGIDSLHVRAVTLSAPGAPVFSAREGAVEADMADVPGVKRTGDVAPAGGRLDAGSAWELGPGGGRGGLRDAAAVALQRLEAASLHTRAAPMVQGAGGTGSAAENGARGHLGGQNIGGEREGQGPGLRGAEQRQQQQQQQAHAGRPADGAGERAQGPGQRRLAADLVATFLPTAHELTRGMQGSATQPGHRPTAPEPQPSRRRGTAADLHTAADQYRQDHAQRPAHVASQHAIVAQREESDDADPLAVIAALAQRRGNAQLAATLSGLAGSAPNSARSECSGSAYTAARPSQHVSGLPGRPAQPQYHHQQQQPRERYAHAPRQGEPAGRHPAKAQTRISLLDAPLPALPQHGPALGGPTGRQPQAPHRPLYGEDVRPRHSSSDGTTSSSSSSSTASSGVVGPGAHVAALLQQASGHSVLERLGDGAGAGGKAVRFDADPLQSPLRGVLGQCRRLQRGAAQREVAGSGVVREVVAALSPRSAVATAVHAMLQERRGQAGVGR